MREASYTLEKEAEEKKKELPLVSTCQHYNNLSQLSGDQLGSNTNNAIL